TCDPPVPPHPSSTVTVSVPLRTSTVWAATAGRAKVIISITSTTNLEIMGFPRRGDSPGGLLVCGGNLCRGPARQRHRKRARLPLHAPDRPQPHDLAPDARAVARIHDVADVLVRARRLLGGDARRGGLDEDALLLQSLEHVLPLPHGGGLRAGEHAPGAVAAGAEGLRMRALGAGQHVGGGAHVAGDEDGLADAAVVAGHVGVARGEAARGALAVDVHLAALAVHDVLLQLGDVVAHVVEDVHAHALGVAAEHLAERLARPVGDELAVGPCEVGRRAHGAPVVLRLAARDGRGGQLAVHQVDVISIRGLLHALQVVGADLVARAAGAAVDHDAHLPLPEAEGARGDGVERLVHHLNLQEVVAPSEAAHLGRAARDGLLGDLVDVGAGHAAAVLHVGEVALPAVAVGDGPPGALGEDVLHLAALEADARLLADARGNLVEERVHQGAQVPAHVLLLEVGLDEPHAAVDVEAHAARGEHALVRVEGRDAADGEAVPPVDVGHRHAAAHDAGERRDVGHLLEGVVLLHVREERVAGEDAARDAHAREVRRGDVHAPRVYADKLARPGHRASHHPLPGKALAAPAPSLFAFSRAPFPRRHEGAKTRRPADLGFVFFVSWPPAARLLEQVWMASDVRMGAGGFVPRRDSPLGSPGPARRGTTPPRAKPPRKGPWVSMAGLRPLNLRIPHGGSVVRGSGGLAGERGRSPQQEARGVLTKPGAPRALPDAGRQGSSVQEGFAARRVRMADVLTTLSQGLLFLTFMATLVAWLRQGGRERAEIAFMFGSLGVTTIISAFSAVTGITSPYLSYASALAYLMLRLVGQFRRVPRGVLAAAMGGMALSWIGLGYVQVYLPLARHVAPDAAPTWPIVPLIVYFVLGEAYAAYGLVEGAVRSAGVARRRLQWAAAGTGILALLIGAVGILIIPAVKSWDLRLVGALGADYVAGTLAALGFLCILSFYIAFSPPLWLRRAWRLAELESFLVSTLGRSVEEHAEASTTRLADVAVLLTGARGARVVARRPRGWVAVEAGGVASPAEEPASGPEARAMESREPVLDREGGFVVVP